jgi:hypothetical protein
MHYYKVAAENIRRLDIGKAAEEMEQLGVIVMTAGRDDVFDKEAVWILASENKLGNQPKDIVWRYNDGAWCAINEINEEVADSYC